MSRTQTMATRVQKQLQAFKKIYPWISSPLIISAPMRAFAGPNLVTAVTQAGGIGFLGHAVKSSQLDIDLYEVRRILEASELRSGTAAGVLNKIMSHCLPIGVAIQTFDSDLSVVAAAIKTHKPTAAWLFAPRDGQAELDIWSQKIRDVSPQTQIWIQVGSVADSLKAAQSDSPPDVLVLQGIDAGGHGLSKGAGIISLLPEAADALRDTDIPLIAAGGIADGRGVASVLTLGAVGAAMGTRFLASEEAVISKGYLEDILRTTDGGQSTVRTSLYDQLAGRADWPPSFDGRNIVNNSILDQESGMPFAENKSLFANALKMGDSGWGPNGRLTAYVGSAVGLVREVTSAESIVKSTRAETIAALTVAGELI